MEFSDELLFFFSALGAFNGLLLGFYFLFFAKPKHISNYFLGGLLVAMSIRIGKSVFYYFNPDLDIGYLQFGLSACLFIGPFLYFYIQSVIEPYGHIGKSWIYHVMILLPIVLVGGYLYSFEANLELWNNYVISGIYNVWLGYIFVTGYVLKDVFKKLLSKAEKINDIEKWLLSIYIGNAMIWVAYKTCGYGSYILGALCFSFMLYLLILLLVFRQKKASISYKALPKYADKKIDPNEAKQYLSQLEQIMLEEELFKKPNLKLPDVAKKMNVPAHRLSQLLNDNIGKNFPQFINEYRIKAAKKLIKTNDMYSLEAIGYECGFNSKSTFYATFKKLAGTTPAKYKSSLN